MAEGGTALPTAEEFFGTQDQGASQQPKLPTAEEFFAPSEDEKRRTAARADLGAKYVEPVVTTAKAAGAAALDVLARPGREAVKALGFTDLKEMPIHSGPIYDEFFTHTAIGRVMDAMGQGFKQGWGEGPKALNDNVTQYMKDAGWWNDYDKQQRSFAKSMNEAFFRPVVAAGSTVAQGVATAATGLLQGASQGFKEATDIAYENILKNNLPERLAKDIAGMPEAFPTAGHHFGVPKIVHEARDLGVIGRGEAGWKGTAAAEDPKVAQRRWMDAYKDWDEEREAQPGAAKEGERVLGGISVEGDATTGEVSPPTIHEMARSVDPDTFAQYDALEARRDTFRRWLDELGEVRKENPKVAEMERTEQDILSKVNGVEDRLTKTQAAALEEARTERQRLLTTDSADMQKVRTELQKADYAMRDLAPQVSHAYREARGMVPEEGAGADTVSAPTGIQSGAEIAPEVTKSVAEPGIQSGAEEKVGRPGGASDLSSSDLPRGPETEAQVPTRAPIAEGAESSTPVKPIEEQKAAIANDVSRKLVAAGRPQAEADAAAQVIAARYATRAARFNGAKGTAEELYRAEGADIRAGRGASAPAERERVMAQPEGKELEQPAYHGSPYKFDEFTTDHIGKGEGAQAYGWGLYFAGEKKVAEYYREALSEQQPIKTFKMGSTTFFSDGRPVDYGPGRGSVEEISKAVFQEAVLIREHSIREAFAQEGVTGVKKVMKAILDDFITDEGQERGAVRYYQRLKDQIDRDSAITGVRFELGEKEGRLYHVELKPTDDELLHWDKPLSEQPKAVQDALERLMGHKVDPERSASTAYIDVGLKKGGAGRDAQEVASKALMAEGVRGIKYLDQQSRGRFQVEHPNGGIEFFGSKAAADTAAKRSGGKVTQLKEDEGSHNYVIFDGADAVIREYEQGARGRVKFQNDSRALVTLMKDADASTFMHESGHVFLEEMMRDAADEAAPQVLRDDMATVRKWLGVEDGAEIKRAQHEKFARGFERYLMEGRAPSSALARVFEQFKTWLTSIYQTVAKLRSPISDDIRGVFDRLLEENPEPVIAAEREAVPNIGQAHEALAEGTSVADVMPTVKRMDTEAETYVKERLSEMYDDFYPGRGTGTDVGRGAATPENGAGAGDAAGARPGAEGGAAEPGTVVPGAGGAPAQAPAGAAAAAGTAQRSTAGGVDVPAGPTNLFGKGETKFIDKAGNIRVDGLNEPDDVIQAIREAAEQNNNFVGARRGVVSDAQVIQLAEAAGVDPVLIREKWQIGKAFNAEDMYEAYSALLKSATDVRNAAQLASTGLDADVMAYFEARERHRMIQEVVAGVTAEAGRALRSIRVFREMQGVEEAMNIGAALKEQTGKTLYQLKREAKMVAKMDDTQSVSKALRSADRSGYGSMWIEYWVNDLVSGPLTQMKNIVANLGGTVLKITESGAAGALGEVRERVGLVDQVRDASGNVIPQRAYVGEVRAQLYGIMKAAPDAVLSAWKVFKDEDFLEYSKYVEQRQHTAIPSATIEIGRNDPGSEAFAAKIENMAVTQARNEGLKGENLEKRAQAIMSNPTAEMLTEAERKTIEVGGKQLRLPTRALSAADYFFKAINRRAEYEQFAYRQAAAEGLEGNAAAARQIDLVNNPTPEMLEAAKKAENYWTYNTPVGQFGRGALIMANSNPLVRMVVTFVRTPINVVKFNVERTPLGAFARETRDNLIGKNGGAEADMQRARLMVGTAIGVATVNMVMQGIITDGGPTEPNERAALMRTGWQPYAANLGGHYIPLAWTPVGILMGLYADTVRMWDYLNSDQQERIPALLFASVTKNLTNQTFLQGPAQLIQATSDSDRYGERYLQNLVGSMVVPGFAAQLARTGVLGEGGDPYLREVHSVLDAIRVRVPFASEGMFPRRDVWGEKMLREVPVHDDPLERQLMAIGYFPAKLSNKIRGVELKPEQYDEYATVAGRSARMRLEAVMSNPQFEMAPAYIQREIAKTIVDNAREGAMSLMLARYPSIMKAAVDDKVDALKRPLPRRGPIKQEPQP